MVKFYILNGDNKRECTATDPAKAAQILALMFHNSKGYVVHDNKIVFAQNMSVEDAEVVAGLKPVAAPVIVAPKAAAPVKAKKVTAKPAKKAKVKSKVVVKAKKPTKKPAKKTVVKVKPKTKVKAKVKANNKNGKAKKKNGKHR